MEITTPKRQLYNGSKIYYVGSRSNPDEIHIVVHVETTGQYFCDCRDFFIRRLPLIGTPAFSLCDHAKHVKNGQPEKLYGIFVVGTQYRASYKPLMGMFESISKAKEAIDFYSPIPSSTYEVRPL